MAALNQLQEATPGAQDLKVTETNNTQLLTEIRDLLQQIVIILSVGFDQAPADCSAQRDETT